MVYRPEWYHKKEVSLNTHTCTRECKIFILYTRVLSTFRETTPTARVGVHEGCFTCTIASSSYVNPKRVYGAGKEHNTFIYTAIIKNGK